MNMSPISFKGSGYPGTSYVSKYSRRLPHRLFMSMLMQEKADIDRERKKSFREFVSKGKRKGW